MPFADRRSLIFAQIIDNCTLSHTHNTQNIDKCTNRRTNSAGAAPLAEGVLCNGLGKGVHVQVHCLLAH